MGPVPCLQAFPKPLKNTVRAVTGLPQMASAGIKASPGTGKGSVQARGGWPGFSVSATRRRHGEWV